MFCTGDGAGGGKEGEREGEMEGKREEGGIEREWGRMS